MRKTIYYLLLFPAILMVMSSTALAVDSAISTMAAIVTHLNHYPSCSEIKILAGIIHDDHATSGEKTLAGALMHMRHSHKVGGDEDARKLQNMISDDHASKQEKVLADILLGLAHYASEEDKERLQPLMH